MTLCKLPRCCTILRLSPFVVSNVCHHSRVQFTRGLCSQSTVDHEEIHRFASTSSEWHKMSDGSYHLLRAMNRLRVPFIKDSLTSEQVSASPLKGIKIADVGCGGGLLSLPLARLGADVTAIDMCKEAVESAQTLYEQYRQELSLQYRVESVEALAEKESGMFDALVASDVIEHVNNPSVFVEMCVKTVKPGGSLFFTTINKTQLSRLLAVWAAEDVAGFVPKGTHQWDRFVSPQELVYQLEKHDCTIRKIHGMCFNVLTQRWSWSNSTHINYALHCVKADPDTKSSHCVKADPDTKSSHISNIKKSDDTTTDPVSRSMDADASTGKNS